MYHLALNLPHTGNWDELSLAEVITQALRDYLESEDETSDLGRLLLKWSGDPRTVLLPNTFRVVVRCHKLAVFALQIEYS